MPFGQYVSRKRNGEEEQSYDVDSVGRQIENAKLRIQDSGFTPKENERNWFEKLTNLPTNQNAFLDTLELLNRPTQGIMNVLYKGGDNAGKEFIHGLSGKDRVSGSDVAGKWGIKNKVGQFALGTGLEIALDPLNLVPGGALVKGASAVGKGIGKGVRVAEDFVPALRLAREATEPAVTATKDALGKVFVPKYGWERTLTGEADDTLKKSYDATRRDIRVQTDKSLANVADIAKTTGVDAGADVGRIMENDLNLWDEFGQPLPRPVRELSTNEEVQSAAQNLLKSNETLRQWALDNGVSIKGMEGYMTHILSAEERKLRSRGKAIPLDRGNFGAGQPNKKILNARTLQGSVEDINDQVKRNLFEPNAYFATAIGQKRLIEYANAVKFRREVLSNPSFATKYTKGDIVPEGAVKIDTNNYKFIKDDTLDGLGLADEIGGEYIVTKGAKEALDRYKKMTTDEGVNAFFKAFDATQSVWKRAALFSVPYHLRNDIGAKFNNWVAGMNIVELGKYSAEADVDVVNAVFRGKPSKLYQEYVDQGLSSASLSKVEFMPYDEPEKAITKTITERSKSMKEQAISKLNPLRAFETSREFGDFADQTNRFALYKWGRESKKLSPEQARELVNRVQFDYTNTTTAEKEIFARAFPFYRWMRNNIPFQIRQFAENPQKYSRINKVRLNAQEAAGIENENVPQWMKEQFAIAAYGKDGSGKFISTGLPLADIIRATDPLKTAVDSVTPLIKTPAELSLNRNFFYDKPIEKFKGQEKQFQVPGTNMEFGIPSKVAYLAEQATGQIGRGFSQYLQKPEDKDQDLKFRKPSLGISNILKDYDAKKAEYYQKFDELQRLQDQLDYIEQQTGQRPRTVREIR